MKIKNKVKQITCNSCGSTEAQMHVCTKKDHYEDSLGLDASGKLTDGMNIEHGLEDEIIKQQGDEWDNCICEACDEDATNATVEFEDGTVLNSEDDDIIKYWLEAD